MDTIKAIQIIGTQRSGSNLLRVMLNQIEEIDAPHPPHILKRFFPLLPKYGDLNIESNFEKLIDDVCRLIELNPVPWGEFKLNRIEIKSNCQSHSLIEIFNTIYSLKAKYSGAKYWCCKSMSNVYFSKEIEKLNVKPIYIHLYRDGRDVALSFKKAIVGQKHIFHLAKQWKEDQERCLKLKKETESNRFFSISYEELLRDPEKILKQLCGVLKIPFNNSMLSYYNSNESLHTAQSGEMWKNVAQPVIKNNFNKFLTEMKAEDLMLFEQIAGTTLNEFNYKLSFIKSKKTFSKKELESFELENELLKKKAVFDANKEDLLRKREQLNLLKEIAFKA